MYDIDIIRVKDNFFVEFNKYNDEGDREKSIIIEPYNNFHSVTFIDADQERTLNINSLYSNANYYELISKVYSNDFKQYTYQNTVQKDKDGYYINLPFSKYQIYIDKKDFNTAQKLVVSAIDSGKLLSIYEYEAKSELLFCKIMNGASENEINELYDKTLKKYITDSATTQIAKRRILYAYNFLFKKDNAAAQREYEAAMAMKETYPSAGELKSELSIIEYIKNVKTPI